MKHFIIENNSKDFALSINVENTLQRNKWKNEDVKIFYIGDITRQEAIKKTNEFINNKTTMIINGDEIIIDRASYDLTKD